MKKTDILTKAYFALWFLTVRNPLNFKSPVRKQGNDTPYGLCICMPLLRLGESHGARWVYITYRRGVTDRCSSRLDGLFLGASARQTSDRMRLPLFVYMVRTITKNKSQNSEPQRTYRRHVFWTYQIHFSIILRI